jgi:hypothetical protein
MLLVGAALAAALFAAGCGEDETAKYRDSVDTANKRFESELKEAGAKMRAAGVSKNRAQYSDGAQQLQAAVTEFSRKLEELDEPAEAKEEEKALVESLRRFGGTVGRIDAAVQSDDEKAIRTEIAALQPQAQQVEAAGDALEKAVD